MKFRITTSTTGDRVRYRAQVKEWWWQPIWINAYSYREVGGGEWVDKLETTHQQIKEVIAQREKELTKRRQKKTQSHRIVKYDPQDGMFS